MLKELKRKINRIGNKYLNNMKKIKKDQYKVGLKSKDAHNEADKLLVEFVEELGFNEIAETYRGISKMYEKDFYEEERY